MFGPAVRTPGPPPHHNDKTASVFPALTALPTSWMLSNPQLVSESCDLLMVEVLGCHTYHLDVREKSSAILNGMGSLEIGRLAQEGSLSAQIG